MGPKCVVFAFLCCPLYCFTFAVLGLLVGNLSVMMIIFVIRFYLTSFQKEPEHRLVVLKYEIRQKGLQNNCGPMLSIL